MKKWTVKFVSLLVFNVGMLLAIGFFTPARVGWAALWAGVILTAATVWIKPALHRAFTGAASKSAGQRTKVGEKVVQFATVFLVALIVWFVTVLFSGVSVGGWFWGYLLPPLIILIGWTIYDAIDDRVEAHAGALYDRATSGRRVDAAAPRTSAPAAPPSSAAAAGHAELRDGLTAEQRKMLDELG